MNTQRAHLVERLSVSRPGYRLIDLVDSAVPVFLVKADVLMIERRPIGPIDEFVLKSIDDSFVTPDEIAGILGLERPLVIETLVGLQREDHVVHRAQGDYRELALTQRGAALLETQLREAPTREQIRIGFDRLTWDVTAEAQTHLMKPAELEDSGRWEIRPKLKRRVTVRDLDIDDIARVVRSLRARAVKPTVLAVERVVRADRFFLPADVAIYESLDGGPPQLSVLVDGRTSEPHESALERLGGLEFIGAELTDEAPDPIAALAADYGDDDAAELAQQAPTGQERESARRERILSIAESEPAGAEQETVDAPGAPLSPITTSAVQFIDTFEHRDYLDRALTETRHRLVIISPWITASVVNRGFQERLLQLLRKGVRVHIGYGLEQRPGDRAVSKADLAAEQALQNMANRHENFTLVKLGNTHSKQLLFDDTHVSGSFNWLSFQGTRSKQYRHEESTVVRIKRKVDAKYADLCGRLERAEVSENNTRT